MLHAKICESLKLSEISCEAEVLYYRLMTQTDDNGNFFADPRLVAGRCAPLRSAFTAEKIKELVEELQDAGLVTSYEDSGGETYLHVNRFHDFQVFRKDIRVTAIYPIHPKELGPCVSERYEPDTERSESVTERDARETPRNETLPKLNQTKVNQSQANPSAGSDGEKVLRISKPDPEKVFEAARKRFRHIVRKSIGSISGRENEWAGLVVREGEDIVIAAIETWATENKDFLKRKSSFPLGHFLKNKSEWVEAAKMKPEPTEKSVPEEEQENADPDLVYVILAATGTKQQVTKDTAQLWIASGYARSLVQ